MYDKRSKDIRSNGQNVERQKVERHMVEWTKGRKWTKGRMDKKSNGQKVEWTKGRKWTKCRMDKRSKVKKGLRSIIQAVA